MISHGTKRLKTRIYILICILILAFIVFLKIRENYAKITGEPEVAASSITVMPEWNLYDLEGNKVPSEFLKGNVALITFWAMECETCLSQISVIKDLEAQYADKGFKTVAIILDVRDDSHLKGFVKGAAINYIVLRGDADVVRKFAHVKEVPESFLFDRKGAMIYYSLGEIDQAQISALIENSL